MEQALLLTPGAACIGISSQPRHECRSPNQTAADARQSKMCPGLASLLCVQVQICTTAREETDRLGPLDLAWILYIVVIAQYLELAPVTGGQPAKRHTAALQANKHSRSSWALLIALA